MKDILFLIWMLLILTSAIQSPPGDLQSLSVGNFTTNTPESTTNVKTSLRLSTNYQNPQRISSATRTSNMINLKYSEYLNTYKPNEKPTGAEYIYRQLIYTKNLLKINQHNANPNSTYKLGLNQFTDLEENEFTSTFTKLYTTKGIGPAVAATVTNIANAAYDAQLKKTITPVRVPAINLFRSVKVHTTTPLSVPTIPANQFIDWSNKTSQVIFQGRCGSCYIISPLESVFITYRIYNKKILPLSIQEVLSCKPPEPDLGGCVGGYFESAFQYMRLNGVGPNIMYPYDSRTIKISECNRTTLDLPSYKQAKVSIKQYISIRGGDCATLVAALKLRAISVAIASQQFQFYTKGLFTTTSTDINHGVTLVGYDPDNQYKIKNSWGIGWGIRGFAYISQSTGICDYGIFPVTGVEGI